MQIREFEGLTVFCETKRNEKEPKGNEQICTEMNISSITTVRFLSWDNLN